MARPYKQEKSFKEKFKELKDLLNGKKTVEAFERSLMPPRSNSTFIDGDVYKVEGMTMNKDEYEIWLQGEREKGPITHVIHWHSDPRNEPIIETEETEFPDGVTWKESRQYAARPNMHSVEFHDYSGTRKKIQIEVVKSNQSET